MYKKEVPKLNKENFIEWKSLMKIHIGGLEDYTQTIITTKNVVLVGSLIIKQLKHKKEHNQEMLEIASTLSYLKFKDIKTSTTSKGMWDSLQNMYGGNKNVLRTKAECLK